MEDQDDFCYLENFIGKSLLSEIETESMDTDLTATTPTKTEDDNIVNNSSDTKSNLSFSKSQDFDDIVSGRIYSGIIQKYYLNDTQNVQNSTEVPANHIRLSGLANYNVPDISDVYNQKEQLQKYMDGYMHQQELYRQGLQIIGFQSTDVLTTSLGVTNQRSNNNNNNTNNSNGNSKVNHYANKIAESFFSMDLSKSVSQTYGSDVGVDGIESPAETSMFPISRCSSNDENYNGVKEVDDLTAQTNMTSTIPPVGLSKEVVKKTTSKQLNTNAAPFVSSFSPFNPNSASSFYQLNDASADTHSNRTYPNRPIQSNSFPKYRSNPKNNHRNYQYRNNNEMKYFPQSEFNLDYTQINDNDATWYTQMLGSRKTQKNNRGSKGPRPGEVSTLGRSKNVREGTGDYLGGNGGSKTMSFDKDLDLNSQLKISNAFKSDMLNRARQRQLG